MPLVLLVVLAAGWGWGCAPRAPAPAAPSGPVPSAAPGAAPGAAQDFLRPGDLVRLRIWREPELSGEFAVDEAGVVTFPRLGPRPVTRLSPDQLKRELLAGYDEFLLNPSIEVVLLRRVNILGAVARPGLYPVDPTMTVADALALAGGTTTSATPDRVDLIRGAETHRTRLSRRTRIADSAVRSGDQLYVPERSWIAQNAALVSIGVSAALGVVGLLLR